MENCLIRQGGQMCSLELLKVDSALISRQRVPLASLQSAQSAGCEQRRKGPGHAFQLELNSRCSNAVEAMDQTKEDHVQISSLNCRMADKMWPALYCEKRAWSSSTVMQGSRHGLRDPFAASPAEEGAPDRETATEAAECNAVTRGQPVPDSQLSAAFRAEVHPAECPPAAAPQEQGTAGRSMCAHGPVSEAATGQRTGRGAAAAPAPHPRGAESVAAGQGPHEMQHNAAQGVLAGGAAAGHASAGLEGGKGGTSRKRRAQVEVAGVEAGQHGEAPEKRHKPRGVLPVVLRMLQGDCTQLPGKQHSSQPLQRVRAWVPSWAHPAAKLAPSLAPLVHAAACGQSLPPSLPTRDERGDPAPPAPRQTCYSWEPADCLPPSPPFPAAAAATTGGRGVGSRMQPLWAALQLAAGSSAFHACTSAQQAQQLLGWDVAGPPNWWPSWVQGPGLTTHPSPGGGGGPQGRRERQCGAGHGGQLAAAVGGGKAFHSLPQLFAGLLSGSLPALPRGKPVSEVEACVQALRMPQSVVQQAVKQALQAQAPSFVPLLAAWAAARDQGCRQVAAAAARPHGMGKPPMPRAVGAARRKPHRPSLLGRCPGQEAVHGGGGRGAVALQRETACESAPGSASLMGGSGNASSWGARQGGAEAGAPPGHPPLQVVELGGRPDGPASVAAAQQGGRAPPSGAVLGSARICAGWGAAGGSRGRRAGPRAQSAVAGGHGEQGRAGAEGRRRRVSLKQLSRRKDIAGFHPSVDPAWATC